MQTTAAVQRAADAYTDRLALRVDRAAAMSNDIDQEVARLAEVIANSSDNISRDSIDIDGTAIRVLVYTKPDEYQDYYESADSAMAAAALGCDQIAVNILRQRRAALIEYLKSAPFLRLRALQVITGQPSYGEM